MNKKTIRITNKCFDDFYREDALDSLAYYCQLKSLFHKPIIYKTKFSAKRNAAMLLNVSYNAFKTHYNVIEKLGYIETNNGNIYIKTNRPKTSRVEINNKKRKLVIIPISIQETVLLTKKIVHGVKIISNLVSQSKTIVLKEQMSKVKFNFRRDNSPKELRALRKHEQKKGEIHERSNISRLTLSNQKIASIMGYKTKATGLRYKKHLVNLGVLKTRLQYCLEQDVPAEIRYNDFETGKKCYFLDPNTGYMFRQIANEFSMPRNLNNFKERKIVFTFSHSNEKIFSRTIYKDQYYSKSLNGYKKH